MNTIGSVYYGWAFLICCGAGSYYFAKRSINAERYDRQAAENDLRMRRQRQMAGATQTQPAQPKVQPQKDGGGGSRVRVAAEIPDHAFSPAREAASTGDPAPSDSRSPGEPYVQSDSQFEAARPFRSKKGDRFS